MYNKRTKCFFVHTDARSVSHLPTVSCTVTDIEQKRSVEVRQGGAADGRRGRSRDSGRTVKRLSRPPAVRIRRPQTFQFPLGVQY